MLSSAKEAKSALRKLMRERLKFIPQTEIERQCMHNSDRMSNSAQQSNVTNNYLDYPLSPNANESVST